MYVNIEIISPANRNSNSHVTNIGITSPLGKAKRICVPVREATATVLVLYGYFKYREYYTANDNKSQYKAGSYTHFSEVFASEFLF